MGDVEISGEGSQFSIFNLPVSGLIRNKVTRKRRHFSGIWPARAPKCCGGRGRQDLNYRFVYPLFPGRELF